MNLLAYLSFITCFLGACTFFGPTLLADRVIDYQVDGDQYAVVVVMDGISASDAKKMARQRAAEMTVSNGGRYFTIDSEQKTRAIQGGGSGQGRAPGNLYQELILDQDFGRSRLDNMPQTSNAYPALRVVFTIYQSKPNLKAIDACSLTNCNH